MDGSPLRPVVCVRNKEKMKQVEKREDCFILEFDPYQDDFNFSSKHSVSTNGSDLQFLAQKGQIACRDFPHPRHLCGRFPFGKTPYDKHCKLCYCYVCDLPAPCKNWVGGTTSHCYALDDERWKAMRESMRQANLLPVKSATTSQVASRCHRRHECEKFPFQTTRHEKYCQLCICYVCEKPAPCAMWVSKPPSYGHCHAFSNESWRTKREKRQKDSFAIAKNQVASRRHRRHECVKLPFGATSHENHCELCNCYVCEMPAPCGLWVSEGASYGHCHAFSNKSWRRKREQHQKLEEILHRVLSS